MSPPLNWVKYLDASKWNSGNAPNVESTDASITQPQDVPNTLGASQAFQCLTSHSTKLIHESAVSTPETLECTAIMCLIQET